MQNKDEIIVVGGGFAGVGAAIAAARQGKSVLLIERYNCLGGAACFDLVNPFMRYWTHTPGTDERVYLSRGIFAEVIEELRKFGPLAIDATYFNEEYLKLVLNRMCIAAGVKLLFGTTVTGVEKVADGRIAAITVFGLNGQRRLCADQFIDATGDANLAYLAGFPYRIGRDTDHLCQPMTLCFRMAGVDYDLYRKTKAEINPLYQKLQAEGKIKNPREDVLIFKTLTPNILHFNTTRIVKRNPTDPEDVTVAELEAREQIFEIVSFLRENFAAFKDANVITSGIQIGARESRMIEGEVTLTGEDLLAFRKTDDGIAVCNYDIDIHSPDGSGTSHYFFPEGEYYTIPYGCLVPRGSRNLLVAGRCISTTHEAQASIRIMPTCCTTGEAAGIAAAMASDGQCGVGEIDVQALRATLREKGARVE